MAFSDSVESEKEIYHLSPERGWKSKIRLPWAQTSFPVRGAFGGVGQQRAGTRERWVPVLLRLS